MWITRVEQKVSLTYADIYKAVELKIELEILSLDILRLQQQAPIRFYKALHELLNATNPLSDPAEESEEQEDKSVSCCICLSGIGPFQALFIAPCSHCYHYKCIKNILKDNAMFPCPVCRQVANLDASVSMESLQDIPEFKEKVAIFDRMNVDTEPETLGGGNNQFGLEELLASNV